MKNQFAIAFLLCVLQLTALQARELQGTALHCLYSTQNHVVPEHAPHFLSSGYVLLVTACMRVGPTEYAEL